MQIFIPYQSPLDCAKALWNDRLRYNKQCIEVIQIIRAIEGDDAWKTILSLRCINTMKIGSSVMLNALQVFVTT